MCLVSLARFLAPSPRLLPSLTNLCEQLLSREQVQRNGEAPSAKSDMIPLPIMEIVDTPPPLLVCAWLLWTVGPGHKLLLPAAGFETGSGDGATETEELDARRRGSWRV